eukprot:gene1070-8920_t
MSSEVSRGYPRTRRDGLPIWALLRSELREELRASRGDAAELRAEVAAQAAEARRLRARLCGS